MGPREAGTARQVVRTISQQADVRPVTSVPVEIPGAVDVGDQLQGANHGGYQDHREREIGSVTAPAAQAWQPESRHQRDQGRQSDQAHEPATARVDQVHGPPGMCSDPVVYLAVEKEFIRDPQVQLSQDHDREQPGEHHPWPQRMTAPEQAARSIIRNLRRSYRTSETALGLHQELEVADGAIAVERETRGPDGGRWRALNEYCRSAGPSRCLSGCRDCAVGRNAESPHVRPMSKNTAPPICASFHSEYL